MAIIVVTALQHHPGASASLTRGRGTALVLTVSSGTAMQSYGFTLRAAGYRVTRVTLTSANGTPTGFPAGEGPCAPEGTDAVICHTLPYRSGVRQGVKSLVITFATDRCYPAGAGLSRGIAGPSSPCRG